jgi:SpoVK/Ycf46/Vps4 family AAA+-type ATPase
MDSLDDLKLLLRSRHPLITIETVEEQRAEALIARACRDIGIPLMVWTVTGGLRRAEPPGRSQIAGTEKLPAALGHLLETDYAAVYLFKDLPAHLTDAVNQRSLREVVQQFSRTHQTIVLVAEQVNLSGADERQAVPFTIRLPDDTQIKRIIKETYNELGKLSAVTIDLKRSEFDVLVRNLRGLTADEVRRAISRAMLNDDRLDADDLRETLRVKQEMIREQGLLEYIVPDLQLDEVGGLGRLKSWLKQRARAFTKEAAAFGLPTPRGMLLLGVQGCGKSLTAKAVAAAWRMPLLRLDPGSLYDKYVGESERHLRRSLTMAETLAPVVLWIDEIEKGFASAATQSTDGGLSQRMFGTLLSWMQEHDTPIFIVATSNNIQALPPELLRKGRFDEIFFVDLPDAEARKAIFRAHLTRRKRDPADFDLDILAEAADGFSGAEIEQAVVAGLYTAFADKRDIDTETLVTELGVTRPLSVTMAERITELRAWAKERCVPAD